MTHIPSLAERRAALELVLIKHSSISGAVSTILDYLEDPAAISSPSMIEALDIVNGSDPDFADVIKTHELIDEINSEIAEMLALRAGLCHYHSCRRADCPADCEV